MLKELPPIQWPITSSQVNSLLEMVVQLNLQNAGLNQLQQRGIQIMLDAYEIYAKSGGKINYLGADGHRRLFQDAMSFCGPQTGIATRVGDLSAAHAGIDWSNISVRLRNSGMSPITSSVNELLKMSSDLSQIPKRTDDEIGCFVRWLQHK